MPPRPRHRRDRRPRAAAALRFTVAPIAVALASASAGCFGGDDPAPAPAPDQRAVDPASAPNFVIVLTDDQEPASLDVMPHVRRDLGDEGVTFEHAFASVPECCPSRASLLTGQYAHNHGVVSNEPPDGGFNAFADQNTLPVWLQDAGYRTGFVGKYLNLYGWDALGNDPAYVPPGWSEWAALTNHTEYQMYGYSINRNGEVEDYGDSPPDYQTDVLADEADRFLRESAGSDQPFFLEVAPSAPHDESVLEDTDAPRNPRPAPRDEGVFEDVELPRGPSFDESDVSDKPRFLRNDPRLSAADEEALGVLYRSRQESLLAVDDLVHRLVTTLKRAGELDDTVFVFTSDNGFMLGQHRQTGKDAVYEESAGVPLVVRGPGFAAATTAQQPVSNVDIVATLVERSGVRPGLELDGVPLERGAGDRRPPILIEMLTKREFAAIRTRRFVLAEYGKGGTELYDLERDPYELENLRLDPVYRDVRQSLSEKLGRLRDCAGASCR